MKKTIFWTAIATVALLGGCVVDESPEQYEPTRPGYFLFAQSAPMLRAAIDEVVPVFAFATYLAAESDAEREAIHNHYFYTSRFVQSGTKWLIINGNNELMIETGGKQLAEDGALWSYYIREDGSVSTSLPTISRKGSDPENQYTVTLPPLSKKTNYTTAILQITVQPVIGLLGSEWLLSGAGIVHKEELDIDFQITTPMRYNNRKPPFFDEGALTLCTTLNGVTDTAEAAVGLHGTVKISYNGHTNNWDINNGFTIRYE